MNLFTPLIKGTRASGIEHIPASSSKRWVGTISLMHSIAADEQVVTAILDLRRMRSWVHYIKILKWRLIISQNYQFQSSQCGCLLRLQSAFWLQIQQISQLWASWLGHHFVEGEVTGPVFYHFHWLSEDSHWLNFFITFKELINFLP